MPQLHSYSQTTGNWVSNSVLNKLNKAEIKKLISRQVTGIIQKEVKLVKTKMQLEKQLEYAKNNPQPVRSNTQQKLKQFRQYEANKTFMNQQQYLKKKKCRQDKVKHFLESRKQQHFSKCQQQNKRSKIVKERLANQSQATQKYYQQLSETYLNRICSARQNAGQLRQKTKASSTQRMWAPKYQSYQNEENRKVTSFINRMTKITERLIKKDLNNEQRRMKSLNCPVKCLLPDRHFLQEKHIEEHQTYYDNKMKTFNENFSRMHNENLQESKHRRIFKDSQIQNTITKKQATRQEQHQHLLDKIQQKYMRKSSNSRFLRKDKENILAKTSFIKNIHKQQTEQEKENHIKNMNYLYQLFSKLKQMKSTEMLSEQDKKHAMSLLDQNDPRYKEYIEFLNCSKIKYAQKKIHEEQERKKLLKMKAKKQAL